MTKTYNQLSPELKKEARQLHPLSYELWVYKVQGVEIIWSAK